MYKKPNKIFNTLLTNNDVALTCIAYILIFLIVSSWVIPWFIAICTSEQLMYVNAWDEETYLTYQGGWGALNLSGYRTDGLIILMFQYLGLSGAETNFIFDVIVTPFTILLISKAMVNCGVKLKLAVPLSFILLFPSVLFNSANPLVNLLTNIPGDIFFAGKEGYNSALRTPEPQFSLLLISISFYMFSRNKKILMLICPIFFVYPFLTISYIFLVLLYYINRIHEVKRNSLMVFILGSISLYITIAVCLIIVDKLGALNYFKLTASGHFQYSHLPHIPVISVVMIPLVLLQWIKKSPKEANTYHLNIVAIYIIILLVANLNVVSGYLISYKNFYDYGLNFLAGVCIVLFILDYNKTGYTNVALSLCCCFLLLILLLNIDWGRLQRREYSVWISQQSLSKADNEFIYKHPFDFYITSKNPRGKYAYSVNKAIAPIFAYQYGFPFFGSTCPEIYSRMMSILENDSLGYYYYNGDGNGDLHIAKSLTEEGFYKKSTFRDNRCINQNLLIQPKYQEIKLNERSEFIIRW